MLKVENGEVLIRGTGAHLCTELTVLIGHLRKTIAENMGEEFADEQITKAVERSKMTTAELEKLAKEKEEELSNILEEIFEKLLRGGCGKCQ